MTIHSILTTYFHFYHHIEMNGIGSQNRKFQTGKVAKKAAATMVGIKQQLEEGDGAQSEEALRTVAVLAEYREKRGATLMEQHLEKKKEKDAKSGGSSGGGGTKRKAFDRDEVSGGVVVSVTYIHVSP